MIRWTTILIVAILTAAVSASATEVSLIATDKPGAVRIEFDSDKPQFIASSSASNTYSLLDVTFPEDFTLKELSKSKAVSKIIKKDKRLYITISNLKSIDVIKLQSPPRLVIDVTLKSTAPAAAPTGRGIKIMLDPGHGGVDTGVITSSVTEGNIDLKAVQTIAGLLEGSKYKVILTRKDNSLVPIDDRKMAALKQRPDAFISIHMSRSNRFMIYTTRCSQDKTGAGLVERYNLRNVNCSQDERNKRLAAAISAAIDREFKTKSVRMELPLEVLSYVNGPAVMIELPSKGAFENDSTNFILRISKQIALEIVKYVKE